MEVDFEDESLRRLEKEFGYDAGYSRELVKAFRKKMQVIRAAKDERDFRAMRSLNFEKLKGDREGQYSMRLNSQWRLILRFTQRGDGKVLVVISIVDYH